MLKKQNVRMQEIQAVNEWTKENNKQTQRAKF